MTVLELRKELAGKYNINNLDDLRVLIEKRFDEMRPKEWGAIEFITSNLFIGEVLELNELSINK